MSNQARQPGVLLVVILIANMLYPADGGESGVGRGFIGERLRRNDLLVQSYEGRLKRRQLGEQTTIGESYSTYVNYYMLMNMSSGMLQCHPHMSVEHPGSACDNISLHCARSTSTV